MTAADEKMNEAIRVGMARFVVVQQAGTVANLGDVEKAMRAAILSDRASRTSGWEDGREAAAKSAGEMYGPHVAEHIRSLKAPASSEPGAGPTCLREVADDFDGKVCGCSSAAYCGRDKPAGASLTESPPSTKGCIYPVCQAVGALPHTVSTASKICGCNGTFHDGSKLAELAPPDSPALDLGEAELVASVRQGLAINYTTGGVGVWVSPEFLNKVAALCDAFAVSAAEKKETR